ncbi:hypothetical protein PI126_g19951 [Phytophthora idaei]|nr:hypothetical protein PI126_g19951 [Phytophthora idaei]
MESKGAAEGNTVECREAITLDQLLQTVAGQIHVSEVNCKVMGNLESDFNLGNDTLKALGIDVNDKLSQLAVGPPVADEDLFDLGFPEVLPPTEMRAKLEEMVVAVGDHGFDKGYLSFLREDVLEHEDVFLAELLDDPPADVEPLRITLKPDTRPFRARHRRYLLRRVLT